MQTDVSRLEVSAATGNVRWIESRGGKDPSIYANVLLAYDSKPEMLQDLFAKIAIQPLMPMAVHTSPLYLMLSRKDEQHGYKTRYVSSLTLAKYLSQLLFYYTTTHVTVTQETAAAGANEKESKRIAELAEAFDRDYYRLTDELYNQLYPLYTSLSRQEPVPADRLEVFYHRVVRYTYDYFHLIETVIWRIIDPDGKIPLAQLLTPMHPGITQPPTPGEQQAIAKSFVVKGLALNTNLTQGEQAHMCREWFPSLLQSPPTAGQWINTPLMQDYFWFLNVDE